MVQLTHPPGPQHQFFLIILIDMGHPEVKGDVFIKLLSYFSLTRGQDK